jgi:hypothetical protein
VFWGPVHTSKLLRLFARSPVFSCTVPGHEKRAPGVPHAAPSSLLILLPFLSTHWPSAPRALVRSTRNRCCQLRCRPEYHCNGQRVCASGQPRGRGTNAQAHERRHDDVQVVFAVASTKSTAPIGFTITHVGSRRLDARSVPANCDREGLASPDANPRWHDGPGQLQHMRRRRAAA